MDVACRGRTTGSPRPWAGRSRWAGAVALASCLAGCGGDGDDRRREVIPAAEIEYSQAIRTSVAEVPRSELVAAELRHTGVTTPVWQSRVATEDGTQHVVRLDASTGDVLETKVAPAQSRSDKGKVRALLRRATILPEEAARKVTKPDFGKVSAVELSERNGEVIWSVDVVTIEEGNVSVYDIDATTGKVLKRSVATEG
jgi:uncharacterized membrane protein YkoI